MGNSGNPEARDPAPGWETWMDITGNDSHPYFTKYFYDWNGTEHRSFIDVSLTNWGNGQWQAEFKVIRDDGQIFDNFIIDRIDPLYIIPVELSSFSISILKNKVQLTWTTVTETNNYAFEIQRSTDKVTFKKIGFIQGQGTTIVPKCYSFTDKPEKSNTYYYRLKQIDTNGNFEYFGVLKVIIDFMPSTYSLAQNYPNPFNPYTILSFSLPKKDRVKLEIFDINGELIK